MEYIIGVIIVLLLEFICPRLMKKLELFFEIGGILLLIGLAIFVMTTGAVEIGLVLIGFAAVLAMFIALTRKSPTAYDPPIEGENNPPVIEKRQEGGSYAGGVMLGLFLGLFSLLFVKSCREETFAGIKLGFLINVIFLIVGYGLLSLGLL